MGRTILIALIAITLAPLAALAEGDAEVVDARATQSGGTWRFDVTVRHPDTGWEH